MERHTQTPHSDQCRYCPACSTSCTRSVYHRPFDDWWQRLPRRASPITSAAPRFPLTVTTAAGERIGSLAVYSHCPYICLTIGVFALRTPDECPRPCRLTRGQYE